MGLPNLKNKLQEIISKEHFSESDVLYLFVEMRKYGERSRDANLNRLEDTLVKEENCRIIQFFRNWTAHPKKTFGHIPQSIVDILDRISNESTDANQSLENELFTLLATEMESFCREVGISINVQNLFKCTNFIENLRKILHEQPVHLSGTKRVGYNDNLMLCVVSD